MISSHFPRCLPLISQNETHLSLAALNVIHKVAKPLSKTGTEDDGIIGGSTNWFQEISLRNYITVNTLVIEHR